MSSAWIYQDPKQVKKRGEAKAAWYCGWYDPDGNKRGKSCGPGLEGHRNAEKLRKKREAELLTGTYQAVSSRTWEAFRKEYKTVVLDGMGNRNADETAHALDQFERLLNPKKLSAATSAGVAKFVALRRKEQGIRPGTLASPATINKELRHLRAVFRKARRLKWLKEAPEFDFLKEPKRLPTYTPPDHFAALYKACDIAKRPTGLPYPAADWWRGLIMTAFMTGWRIGQLLAMLREDVDLDAGTAVTRAGDNKGKRDQIISLHPVVIDHMRRLPAFGATVFPWDHAYRLLFQDFHRIQDAAEVRRTCTKQHDHADACFYYGFHDLRRAFATMNADRLTPDALQALMQHQDYQTTQRYIAMARQLKPAVQNLYVPDVSNGDAAQKQA